MGTIFSLPASGGTPTALASFGGANGDYPDSLILVGDRLFGTTKFGGLDGDGTVFSYSVASGGLTLLASFDGTDGANPYGPLTLVGSTLYGATQGGGTFNDGTVFSIPIPEPRMSVLPTILLAALIRKRPRSC